MPLVTLWPNHNHPCRKGMSWNQETRASRMWYGHEKKPQNTFPNCHFWCMDTRVHMQEVQQIAHLVDLVVENFKYSQLSFWIRSLNLFHQITNQCTYISGSQLQNSTVLGEFNKKDRNAWNMNTLLLSSWMTSPTVLCLGNLMLCTETCGKPEIIH